MVWFYRQHYVAIYLHLSAFLFITHKKTYCRTFSYNCLYNVCSIKLLFSVFEISSLIDYWSYSDGRVKIEKPVLKPSMSIMFQPRNDRAHTSFPEKVKRHEVQHGVLDVVNLFFQWELQRDLMTLIMCPCLSQCTVRIKVVLQNGLQSEIKIRIASFNQLILFLGLWTDHKDIIYYYYYLH